MSEDERKPELQVGMFVCPIVIPNFATDEKGNCEIAAAWQQLASGVIDETYQKLYHLAEVLMSQVGGVVKPCSHETMMNIIKGALEKVETKEELTNIHGILTPEGKVITDDDAIKTWRKGERIDN
jgi:hypothetical protein